MILAGGDVAQGIRASQTFFQWLVSLSWSEMVRFALMGVVIVAMLVGVMKFWKWAVK